MRRRLLEQLSFIKEVGRVLVLALVSFGLTEGLLPVIVDFVLGVKVDPAVRLVIGTGLLAALKAVDRELHERGIAEKGLTRF